MNTQTVREARAHTIMTAVARRRGRPFLVTVQEARRRGMTIAQLDQALDDLAAVGLIRFGSRDSRSANALVVVAFADPREGAA